ncbi:unnamed protein product [Ilex paraguariensis]|uniref:Uncharacterized protein n=1 Tax=Ilex paraguariensis TaxID=185542 RepID=A0ABC8RBP1_9AQUA
MDQSALPPHVLIFPLPFQGPVNYMFKIVELLCLSGFHITILLTDYIYNRLQHHFTFHYRFQSYPWLHLETISDGLPVDDSHSVARVLDSLRTITKKLFKEIGGTLGGFIAPGLTREIIKPLGYLKGAEEVSRGMVTRISRLQHLASVPGMEGFLRRRDLPSLFRSGNLSDRTIAFIKMEGEENARARGLILNTFEELDRPILSHIRTVCPNLYTFGPQHAHLKAKLAAAATSYSPSSNSLWERRQELHHLARLTTVQICDIRKLWKSCNDDESPAHGVLARFGE